MRCSWLLLSAILLPFGTALPQDLSGIGGLHWGNPLDWVWGAAGFVKELIPDVVTPGKDTTKDTSTSEQPVEQTKDDSPAAARVIADITRITDKKCDPKVNQECQTPLSVIIHARDCKNKITNQAVTADLRNTISFPNRILVAELDGCGEFFWTGKLKPAELETFKTSEAILSGVKSIELDGPIHSHLRGPYHHRDRKRKSTSKTGSLRKRDGSVESRPNKMSDLSFLSTPPNEEPNGIYSYFKRAGEGVVTFVLGPGGGSQNSQFIRDTTLPDGTTHNNHIMQQWLYAIDVIDDPGIDDRDDNEGSACTASKVAGNIDGVASNGELVMTKALFTLSSYLSGILAIVNELQNRGFEKVRGSTIVLLPYIWSGFREGGNELALKELLQILVKSYQAVVVCSAGVGYFLQYDNELRPFPAFYASEELPIITVASVDTITGETVDDIGESLLEEQQQILDQAGLVPTIGAPAEVNCAAASDGDSWLARAGEQYSPAIVAGQVAEYLSRTGDEEIIAARNAEDFPKAIRNLLVKRSYIRQPDGKLNAIANGLSSYDFPTPAPDDWPPRLFPQPGE